MSETTPAFLEGEKVVLRPLRESDIEGTYSEWLNDAEVCEGNLHHRYPQTREDTLNYIRYALTTRDELILAIVDKASETHIGNIALQHISPFHRHAELSILVGDKDYWGKGYAKEACRLIMQHGFTALNLHRIYTGAMDHNLGMIKLAESLGMQPEGSRREHLFKDGQFRDEVLHSILAAEFQEQ